MLERLDSSKPFSTREYYASPSCTRIHLHQRLHRRHPGSGELYVLGSKISSNTDGQDLISNEKLLAIADLS